MAESAKSLEGRKQTLEMKLSKALLKWLQLGGSRQLLENVLRSFLKTSLGLSGVDVSSSVDEVMAYAKSKNFNAEVHANVLVNRFVERRRFDQVIGRSQGSSPRRRVYKRWHTVGDELVRDTHQRVDGQEVLADEPFDVAGFPMMFPGDDSADPPMDLIANCRCTVEYFTK